MKLQCKDCVYWERDMINEWQGTCNHPHKPDTGFMVTDSLYSCELASTEMENWEDKDA